MSALTVFILCMVWQASAKKVLEFGKFSTVTKAHGISRNKKDRQLKIIYYQAPSGNLSLARLTSKMYLETLPTSFTICISHNQDRR